MRQGSDSVTGVPRPKTKLTEQQLAALDEVRKVWEEADQAEERAWKRTQDLRDMDIPDLVICESIPQVTRPTLNRKLGPRKGPS